MATTVTKRKKRATVAGGRSDAAALDLAPAAKTGWSGDDTGDWWLYARWAQHRHTIEEIHPVLCQIRKTKGDAWLTSENVLLILNAKNPEQAIENLRQPAAA